MDPRYRTPEQRGPETFGKSTIWGVTNNEGQMKHVFLIWEEWACGGRQGEIKGVGNREEPPQDGDLRIPCIFLAMGKRDFLGMDMVPERAGDLVPRKGPDQGSGDIFLALP